MSGQQERNLERNMSEKELKEKLEKLYSDINSVPFLSSKLGEFLREHPVQSKFDRILKHKFPTRRVIVKRRFELFMADTIEYNPYMARINRGYRYILLMIDCFTKVIYVSPMKKKNMEWGLKAFEDIFDKLDILPVNICTDDGTEFWNKNVNAFLQSKGVNHFSMETKTKYKAMVAERAIRTIKTLLEKFFYKSGKRIWYGSNGSKTLDQIVLNYNRTPHRSIGMAPLDVTEDNQRKVFKRLYPYSKITVDCRIKKGDKVRKKIEKDKFTKGYAQKWSEEIFIVDSVHQSNTICFYKLKSLDNSLLEGIYYFYQLNVVSKNLRNYAR